MTPLASRNRRQVREHRPARDREWPHSGGPEDPEKWIRERVAKHRDPGEPVVFERSDGTWYQISERKTRDGGVVVVYSDITNIKRSGAEMEASNQRFRDVAEVSGDWLYEMDEDLRFTYISDRFFEIIPVAREALIGRTRQEFAGKALEAPHWQAHYRDLSARKPFRNFEYDVTLPNKELRFLQISGKPYSLSTKPQGLSGNRNRHHRASITRAAACCRT